MVLGEILLRTRYDCNCMVLGDPCNGGLLSCAKVIKGMNCTVMGCILRHFKVKAHTTDKAVT